MAQDIKPAGSPLSQLAFNRFGGATYIYEQVIALAVGWNMVIPNNPNRLFWIITNQSVDDLRLSTSREINATSGWLLSASGGIISMFWEEDGEAVGYFVWIWCSNAGDVVRIREVLRE